MSSESTWLPSPVCSLRCVPCQENLPDSRALCQHVLPSVVMINLDKCAVEKPESEFPFVNQLQIQSQLQGKRCGEMEPPHLRAKMPWFPEGRTPATPAPAIVAGKPKSWRGIQACFVTPAPRVPRQGKHLLSLFIELSRAIPVSAGVGMGRAWLCHGQWDPITSVRCGDDTQIIWCLETLCEKQRAENVFNGLGRRACSFYREHAFSSWFSQWVSHNHL